MIIIMIFATVCIWGKLGKGKDLQKYTNSVILAKLLPQYIFACLQINSTLWDREISPRDV